MNGTIENRTIEDEDTRPPPYYREYRPPQIITSDTARQTPLGMRALIVLLLSLVAAAVACLAIAAIYGHA